MSSTSKVSRAKRHPVKDFLHSIDSRLTSVSLRQAILFFALAILAVILLSEMASAQYGKCSEGFKLYPRVQVPCVETANPHHSYTGGGYYGGRGYGGYGGRGYGGYGGRGYGGYGGRGHGGYGNGGYGGYGGRGYGGYGGGRGYGGYGRG